MNSDWQEEWGGELNMWDGTSEGLTQLSAKVIPRFNTAVLFRTSDISWHGLPEAVRHASLSLDCFNFFPEICAQQVQCPGERGRKSVAIYYVSQPRPDATPRFKASFRPRPGFPLPVPPNPAATDGADGYLELCKLRDERRLEPADLRALVPDWQPRWAVASGESEQASGQQ